MQMRACGTSGFSYRADNVALFDFISFFYGCCVHVRIHCVQTLSVVDYYHIAAIKKVAAA